jgi:hypothetical protein
LIMSMRRFDSHDGVCRYKEVPCVLKCGAAIARKDMGMYTPVASAGWGGGSGPARERPQRGGS